MGMAPRIITGDKVRAAGDPWGRSKKLKIWERKSVQGGV
jgi:hypothetical protein